MRCFTNGNSKIAINLSYCYITIAIGCSLSFPFLLLQQQSEQGPAQSSILLFNRKFQVRTIKQAENVKDYIIRLFETMGKHQKTRLSILAGNLVSKA